MELVSRDSLEFVRASRCVGSTLHVELASLGQKKASPKAGLTGYLVIPSHMCIGVMQELYSVHRDSSHVSQPRTMLKIISAMVKALMMAMAVPAIISKAVFMFTPKERAARRLPY